MSARGRSGTALAQFNALPAAEATQRLLGCCAALGWAERIAAGRPYDEVAELLSAADAVFARLTDAEIVQASAASPPVLEPAYGAVPGTDAAVRRALVAGVAAYEQRFGRSLVVAAGLTPGQLLHVLQVRMRNDPDRERDVAREELRRLARARLELQFAT